MRLRSRLPDLLGLGWTLAAAFVVMAPALRPGISLGPFDLLSQFGVTAVPHTHVHNAIQSDQILFFIPMTNAAWHQVHSGQVPLWNQFNVLGTPLAFNWESAVFSLPMLLAYLAPVSFAYTVVVLVKLLIAGSGAYVFCRVIGLRPLPSALAGTVFELSGSIVHYSGWSVVGVECWTGWVLAGVLLVARDRWRARDVVLLAVSIAFAVYGGYPAGLVLLGIAVLIFLVVGLIPGFLVPKGKTRRTKAGGGASPEGHKGTRENSGAAGPLGYLSRAGALRVVLGGACGLALGAPLILPGMQLAAGSARRYAAGSTVAYPVSHLPNVLVPGLQGNDFKTAAYVGVIAVAFAICGARLAWRSWHTRALVLIAVVMALFTYLSPADHLMDLLPLGNGVHWDQASAFMTFAFAVVAAIGLEELLRDPRGLQVRRWAFGGFAFAAVVIVLVAAAAAVGLSKAALPYLTSLALPGIEAAVGMALFAPALFPRGSPGASIDHRRSFIDGRAYGLVGLSTIFLILAGVSFWSISSTYFAPTPAVTHLQKVLGSNLLGLGSCNGVNSASATTHEVAIRADANIGFTLNELSVYDPILPESYFRSWQSIGGAPLPSSLSRLGIFCARIETVNQALFYGTNYVIEPKGKPGPAGSLIHAKAGTEVVYWIPAAAQATSEPATAAVLQGSWSRSLSQATTTPSSPIKALSATHGDPTTWRLHTHSKTTQVVRLRLTAVPGWHATIDGKPLPLKTWGEGTMLQAEVPPGSHSIEVHYWPDLFTAGIVTAVVGAIVVITWCVVGTRRRRRPLTQTDDSRTVEPETVGSASR